MRVRGLGEFVDYFILRDRVNTTDAFAQVFVRRHMLRHLVTFLFFVVAPLPVLAQTFTCSPPLANQTVCENSMTGNPQTEWDINGYGDATIQGFATDIGVNAGQTVSFKIATPASAYTVTIYRLGYYGGMGARKITTISPSATLPQIQPNCLTDPTTGLFDCGNWGISASWAVPSNATSGVYIALLTRTDTGGRSHIPFIVRNDSSHSDIVFQTSDTTWQAYNWYGGTGTGAPGNGQSLYGCSGGWSPSCRAFKVSYNRPFDTRGTFGGPADFLFNAEYPMIRWLERNGYDVSYTTDIDTDRNGSLLLNHKTFLSVGHDEYWNNQRASVEAARTAGVNLAFFSGNEIFWKTRWESSIAGTSTPYRTLVTYKESQANAVIDPADPPTWTGLWRDPRFSPPADGGRPENALSGTSFIVNGPVTNALVIPQADGRMRFWRNTAVASLASGQSYTTAVGILGYEWDETPDNGSSPAGLVHLSTSTYSVSSKMLDYGSTFGSGTATHHLTLYRHPSGALVFGAGTFNWPWGLDATHDSSGVAADVNLQQATVNLFADMGMQPATLQSGLLMATASTDTAPPISVITFPSSGSALGTGATITITGTAADSGGGVVGGVEVSVDGGSTWHPAIGRESWSYSWTTPNSTGSVTIRSRAVDDSENLETPSSGVTVNISAGPDFTFSASPSSQTVIRGNPTSYTATTTALNGFTGVVTLSVTGLPTGATGTFNPTSVTGSGSSTLSVTTSSTTPTGSYTLTLTGTSGSLTHSATTTLVVNPPPDFSLAASPSSQTVMQGGSTSYTATVGALNGFTGVVTLSVTGLPTGATGTFNPTSVTNSGSSTLSVTTSSTTPTGSYTLTLTGTSGTLSHSATAALVVSAPVPDFSLSASPSSRSVVQGSPTTYTATVGAVNGFGGVVTLSATGLPTGATGTFNPTSVTGSGSSTLNVTTSSTTPTGSYTLTLTGTSGSLSHSTTVTLTVTSSLTTVTFDDISPANRVLTGQYPTGIINWGTGTSWYLSGPWGLFTTQSLSFNGGSQTSGSFTFVSNSGLASLQAYNGGSGSATVTISCTGQTTVTATVAAGTVATINTGWTTPCATVTLATSNGWNTNFDNLSVFTISSTAPDFTLAATPSSQTVIQGNPTSYTATTTALNGFSSAVNFSVTGLPSGATGTFNPTSVTGSGSSTLNVTTSSTTPTGSYTLTLTGTSGSLTHSATTTLVVNPAPDFSLAASPSSRSVVQGSPTTYTATVGALNGFTGVVTLSVTGLPTGATGTFNPTSVTGSGSSTLNVTTSSTTPTGSYTLTLTGTSGSLTHSATTTLVVNPVPDFSLATSRSSRRSFKAVPPVTPPPLAL